VKNIQDRKHKPGRKLASVGTSAALLVTSLTFAALVPSGANAMGGGPGWGGPICPTPVVDLPNCQNYLATDDYCASSVKDQCIALVKQAHGTERAAVTTTKPVLPAGKENTDTLVTAKYVKDSKATQYLNGIDGMYVANNLSSDLSVAQGTTERLAAALDNPCTREAQAAGRPNQICSCTQYSYDTFYSARPFERKVSQKGLDYRALYNEAKQIANTNVTSKDGLYQTTFIPHQVARTKFHEFDSWQALYPANTPAASKHQWDATLRTAYDNTYKTYTMTQAKHDELSNLTAAWPDERKNYLFNEQLLFADTVRYRKERWAAYQAKSDAEKVATAAATAAELKAIDAQIEEGLRRGKDLGCVPSNVNTVTPCDWSPMFFYHDSQSYFSKLGEERYQQCVQLTGDYFGNTPATALTNSLNFTNHLATENTSERKLGSVTSDIDNTPTVGQQFSDEGRYGSDDFNVAYAYNFSWGVTDYDHKDAAGNPLFCKANLRAGGTLDVTGSVFGMTRNVVDFDAWAYTKTESNDVDYLHEEMSMKILGDNLFQPIDVKQQAEYHWAANPSRSLGKNGEGYKTSKTFIILAVPVTVTGGLTGTFGIDMKLDAGIIRDCVGAPDLMNIGVATHVKPYIDLNAYVSAGVGWPGLSIGVKGEVVLIEASMPFNAKAGLELQGTNTGANLFLVAKSDLALNLRTLSGKVSVYVEYIIDSSEWELFSWNGYEVKSKLFDFDAKYPLIVIANMPTTTTNN
jgi:hypothetical protein